MYVLASKKKIEFLKQAESVMGGESTPSLKLVHRDKADKDKSNYKKIIEAIKGSKKVRIQCDKPETLISR